MKVTISHLGVIQEADIDLTKKVILFCGINNSGKTYLSYVINYIISNDDNYDLNIIPLMDERQVFKAGADKMSLNKGILDKFLENKSKMIKSDLGSVFGISEELVQQLFADFDVSLSISETEWQNVVSNAFSDSIAIRNINVLINKARGSSDFFFHLDGEAPNGKLFHIPQIYREMLYYLLIKKLAFGDISDTHFFPVERNSIYTFKTELSISRNELIEKIQDIKDKKHINPFDFIENRSRRYPLAIRESLRIANDL